MANYQIFLLLGSLFGSYLFACYLDKRYGIKLVDWANGKIDNPFVENTKAESTNSAANKDISEVENLKERIAVLEKVVTEPAYELNKKINSL